MLDFNQLRSHLVAQVPDMLALLERLVQLESPSNDKPALDNVAESLAYVFTRTGASVERLYQSAAGDHLCLTWSTDPPNSKHPILVLGHFDTVWPKGTTAHMPFRINGPRAFGPGAFDMKASLVIFAFAMQALRDLRIPLPRPITALLTSDEEIGSSTSRKAIEDAAQSAAFTLVIEPALPNGGLKTARKGVGAYILDVHGRAAHAGVEPEKGRSAVLELAHQILHIQALGDLNLGTSVNVGLISGGSAANTIPAQARAQIDVRVSTAEEAKRVDAALRALRPVTEGTALEIDGGLNRPPMVRTEATAALFEQARALARHLDLDLKEGSTGGGSDGNFTAALGVPTLDGLGCRGDGAHAAHEHILTDSLPERAALLAALITGLKTEH